MEDLIKQSLTVIYPYYLEKARLVREKGLRFAHYTNAEAAMNIIKSKEVWLRNAQCMNDFSEIEHGLECLVKAFGGETHGKKFKDFLNNLFPGIVDELVKLFDAWIPHFRFHTYIVCVSEHSENEDRYGCLSMWRAYGGRNSVALVLNNDPFLAETDVFKAYAYPVEYLDVDHFGEHLDDLRERMFKETDLLRSIGKDTVLSFLFQVFKQNVLCIKHPGFEEEREWRVVYTPKYEHSEFVTTSIETIANVPQEINKIPLRDIPQHGFVGASIPDLIDRIIIGPNDHQLVLGDAFIRLLKNCNCEDAEKRIYYSGIPLR